MSISTNFVQELVISILKIISSSCSKILTVPPSVDLAKSGQSFEHKAHVGGFFQTGSHVGLSLIQCLGHFNFLHLLTFAQNWHRVRRGQGTGCFSYLSTRALFVVWLWKINYLSKFEVIPFPQLSICPNYFLLLILVPHTNTRQWVGGNSSASLDISPAPATLATLRPIWLSIARRGLIYGH